LIERTEVEDQIAQKVDTHEVQRVVSELEAQLQEIPRFDDKVNKVELQYLLSNKVSIQEVSRLLESKAN
jgi:hypothetical protein